MRGSEVIKLCHYVLDIPIHWCDIEPNAVVIMVTVNIYFVTCGREISVDQKFVPFLSIFWSTKTNLQRVFAINAIKPFQKLMQVLLNYQISHFSNLAPSCMANGVFKK